LISNFHFPVGAPIVISTDTEGNGVADPARRRGCGPDKRKPPTTFDGSTPEGSEAGGRSKSRKRAPNWEIAEINALIEGKQLDHNRILDISDNRDYIEKGDIRWGWISDYVMKKTRSDEGALHYRDKESCRDKWQGIYGDYKRIYDYFKGIGLNEQYEDMTLDARAEVGLPQHFSPYHFRLIDNFCKDRPNVHPPHSRDSSDLENNDNFLPNQLHVTDMDTEDIYQDPINLHGPTNLEAGSSWFAVEDTDDNDFMDPPPRR
jgi:hypothetical protein